MPKTYDKKAWLEQKELTKEENLKIIQNIVNNFKEDPEKILEFIDFQSRFYNYSTRNTMLIYAKKESSHKPPNAIKYKQIKSYIPDSVLKEDYQSYVIKALLFYKENSEDI